MAAALTITAVAIVQVLTMVIPTSSLKITSLEVPSILKVGSTTDLECHFEAGSDTVYSIKWYHDTGEFYRYTANNNGENPVQVFDPPVLDVDVSMSYEGRVRITNVTLDARGTYHCEVSGEAPDFHTATGEANMDVVEVPSSKPILEGALPQYRTDEWVDLKCSSPTSNPEPKLEFYINGNPADSYNMEPQTTMQDGREARTSRRLRFSLHQQYLQKGQALVTCRSLIPKVYNEEVQVALVTNFPNPAYVRDSGAATGNTSPAWLYLLTFTTLTGMLLLLSTPTYFH